MLIGSSARQAAEGLRPGGQPSAPRWLTLVGPTVSMCALGVLGFVYTMTMLAAVGVVGEPRDLVLYVFGALLLPLLCAAAQRFVVRPEFDTPHAGIIETINSWAAVALLAGFAALPPLMFVRGLTADFWLPTAKAIVLGVAAAHAVALAIAAVGRARTAPGPVGSRAWQAVGMILALAAASFALYRIDPENPYLNLIVQLYLDPPFSKEPGAFGVGRASLMAALCMAAAAALIWLDTRLMRRTTRAARAAGATALVVTIAAIAVFYFDFSLTNDSFHYMTNVAPAIATMHGATPMVDTFSQYGPGPVIATLVGFQFGPLTFGVAQITTQVFNFAFYAIWLVCLYRMTPWKLASLLLGFLSVAVYFSLWMRGIGNANDAPSVLGLRHLPTLLMVLALSCLPAPRRHSAFTTSATFVSGLWSIETLIGTLGVHYALLGLIGVRDRAMVRLIRDGLLATLPAVAALVAMALATLWRAGALPDIGIYLGFLGEYNMMAESWVVVASPQFFGWLTMLLAILIVLADGWTRALGPGAGVTALDDETVLRRFVPMAMLLVLQGAYFVGRSVDFTLDIALFPFCALAIAGGLGFSWAVASARGPVRLLGLVPAAIGVWALTFTFVALLRQGAPYSLALHECMYKARCSPTAMFDALREQVHKRIGLEKVGNQRGDYWFDARGIVPEALSMVETLAPNAPRVTLLLGYMMADSDDMASDMTLMYAGKWHTWPRSWTFSDRLVLPLAQRIIAAPVKLHAGDLVLVRQEEKYLRIVEAGILKRIRSEYTLCRLPHASTLIAPYRVAGPAGCPPA